MNPINNLVGNAGLAAVNGPGLPVGVGGNVMLNMMHHNNPNPNPFDPNMASSVTLACCQSLCDVLTELPLPSAVVDKSSHTRTLIAGGLTSATRNGRLSDLSIVPYIQQALYMAKQQLNEISFLNNPAPSPYYQQPNAEAEAPNQQPSQLLLTLSSQNLFHNSHSPALFQQQPGIPNNNNNATNNSSLSAHNHNDLNADLQTIEPSIDRHMTDIHPNLMDDVINAINNDDCDMSSSIHSTNSNDLSTYHHPHPHHSAQPSQNLLNSATPQVLNNEYPQNNHYRNIVHNNNNNVDMKTELGNYSSLCERVKSRQREAAQKASQAATLSVMSSNSSMSQPSTQGTLISNSNSQNTIVEPPAPLINHNNNNNKTIKTSESISSNDDKDWQLPSTKKLKTEPTPRKQSTYVRRSYSDSKPQIRSVKYSFNDFDQCDSMLLNSSIDIVERFEQIIDEILATSCNDLKEEYDDDESDDDSEFYDNKKQKKKKKPPKHNDTNHMNGVSFDVSIEAEQLKEIMVISAKLKQNNRVVEIERKKIILFLTVLSNQLNIWFTRYKSKASAHTSDEEEDEDIDEREHYWELCCNASQSALHIMTSSSPNSDNNSLISHEELIEVIIDFLNYNLSTTTHVSTTTTNSRSPKNKKQNVHFGVSKRHVTRWTQLLQLLFEFINQRTKGSLTDTLILSLTRISMSALFLLQNTAEMQFVSIEILCHVFEEYERHRMSILEELLNSLSKISTKKSHRKDSVLTQMLIRLTNAFFQPEAGDSTKSGFANTHTRDSLAKQNTASSQIIFGFLSSFLRKCSQHTSNSEVDFKLIFEALLNDLLDSLHAPHSTSSILIVQIIVRLLISFLSPNQSKSASSSLTARNLAIEYLSIICSKFAQFLAEKDDTFKELEKTLSTLEESEKPVKKKGSKNNNNNNASENSSKVNVNKVWNLLVDYFNSEKLYREKLVLGSIWIKDKYFSDNEQREQQFLQKLNTSKPQNDDNNASVVDISTAALCIQYMEFVQFSTNMRLFEYIISHVTASLSNTTNTTQRSKAMKCLSNILSSSSIEKASELLLKSDLQNAMRCALLDPSTSVREATVDLIGRFVLQSKDQNLCQRYYPLIVERILDTGISVRKRVIKILRDICIEFSEFEKCGEIAAKIVRRINDDGEGIRRLVVDTCRDLWFSPTNSSAIKYKMNSLLHVIATMINDNASLESMQSLFDQLIKPETMSIAQQICDSIMNDFLIDDLPQSKVLQLSAIQCVSMMSQCCPKMMVKHCDTLQSFLSLPCETKGEIILRNKVIQTIERVLPHINNPSPQLLVRIEEDLTKNILQSSLSILQSSVKCLSVLNKHHTKNPKLVVDLFKKFQQILFEKVFQYQNLLSEIQIREEKPKLLRSIFTCGLFAKYFSNYISEYKDRVRDTIIDLIESPYDVDIKCNAIIALGFIIESDPKICLLPNVVDIYTRILRNEFSNEENVQVKKKHDEMFCNQVLNNFRNYLSESIESDENAAKTIEWSRESLKSMQSTEEDSCSAQSQIIQKYLLSILINALNPNTAIRRVACNVIHVIHSGGHVHPLQLVPHLVAMTSDDDNHIRMRADLVLQEIERKYHGFVAMKYKEGVSLSSSFCKRLNCGGYRLYQEKSAAAPGEGLNSVSPNNKEICARLSTLYKVICNKRESRRGFITSLLRYLDTSEITMKQQHSSMDMNSSSTQNEPIDIEFVFENILFFPYTVYDEILYILNQLECTSSINSTHIAQLFKEIFIVEKPSVESSQYQAQQQYLMQQQQQNYPNAYNHYPNSSYPNAVYPNMNYPANSLQENVIVDLEDIDLDNEEHIKKYENNIHVNFNLLLTDTRNERLNNLSKCLRTMYLSTLLRTLLKEFYLLKDEKISDYSTNDAKTWEKPVHRRQIECAHLKEIFSSAQPCLSIPDSLLLSDDLSSVEKQLLDEWKRFRSVSLNNSDPNFKPSILTKLFQTKKETANRESVSNCPNSESKIIRMNSETEIESNYQQEGQLDESFKKSNNLPNSSEKTPKKAKSQSKPKQKQKKKRKRIVLDDDESSSFSEEDDDDDNYEDYN